MGLESVGVGHQLQEAPVTRRATVSAAQPYLPGLAPVPPAPASGTRERPFVVRLRSDIDAGTIFLDLDGAESIGRWPTGEPAVVEEDPGATARVMERRRLRVEVEMKRKGKATPAQQEAGAKVDKRLCGGGKPRRRNR